MLNNTPESDNAEMLADYALMFGGLCSEICKMKRYAMDRLMQWKNSKDRRPLLIMGARQVGKTWLMREFGHLAYQKTAYVSFFRNPRMKEVFEQDCDISRIIAGLNIETGIEITPGDTLIILDEIQEAPAVLEVLKYFCENAPEYHVCAAGSLLGVSLHEGVSFPVGKVAMLKLYPLHFREYLEALGEVQLAQLLETGDYSIIDSFADKYLYWLKNYIYTGGLPAVVNFFRDHKDYAEVRRIQKEIVQQYQGDFGKHIRAGELKRINMVWESIPIQLAKDNKKFFFGQIKKGARSAEFKTAIQWLADAGLVYKVHRVNEPEMPLSAYKDFSAYKLFALDVGILGALSDLDARSILDGNDIFREFRGALAEQYALQEMIAATDYTPYYYGTASASFEQDFIIQKGKLTIPIEVKSGANVRSQSLKAFIAKFHSEAAVRLSPLPYRKQETIINLPLYAVCNL